ncbi:MAG: MjaI family restriction endonuclease [Calditrichaeota bacterium]|nr:MjaI family restriction endonuclease [Calditrichota bacterium]
MKRIAEDKGLDYQLASAEEESQGIDGWVGGMPVSIKPDTYEVKRALPESLPSIVVYYKKTKSGLTFAIYD